MEQARSMDHITKFVPSSVGRRQAGGKKTRDRQAKQPPEKGVRMDIDRENFGRSLLEVVTEFDTQCTQECEAASTFLAIGVRRNDACDVSLVLILDFSACVNTTK
ncbi:uncharacterized protein FOBCDRAFT_261089 [Fusarium oxysporum Fo47]|uniref:uncharacterized protein n=1 Tax=Fusarium oxysporum Fo47 TaxID=660027 RepID=UPI002869CB47|nr:uncharacterized protein FOBCDRAFT_261089 [Fusarium oxysporum Fo47]WJG35361.1 hypothetical protein FOBCDRAFT_261089 [Fusarium oxysporum Fo47]